MLLVLVMVPMQEGQVETQQYVGDAAVASQEGGEQLKALKVLRLFLSSELLCQPLGAGHWPLIEAVHVLIFQQLP